MNRVNRMGLAVLCGMVAGLAGAATVTGVNDGSWDTPATWNSGVPTALDKININQGVTVTVNNTQVTYTLAIGDSVETDGGSLVVDGGNLSFTDTGWCGVGYNTGGHLEITGNGVVSFAGRVDLGVENKHGALTTQRISTLTIDSGAFTSAHLRMGPGFNHGDSMAQINLDGGVISVDNTVEWGSVGRLNIDLEIGGELWLTGNRSGDVAAWIGDGRMTASDGLGSIQYSFDSGLNRTTVIATVVTVVTVPDVTGLPQTTAAANLASAGLTVGTVSFSSDLPGDPPPGEVYSQDPVGGVDVTSGSAVDLVVATPDLPPPETADLTPTTGNTEGAFITTSYAGRTVWQATNPSSMLYFRVPATFDFVEGTPVYVRIEYHDSGRGNFSAEYDSSLGSTTDHKFWDSELHARSSRVETGEFVYNYQMFESPLFNRRQNGQNDFRFQISGSDGTPLRVASVQISNRPFDDEKFLYALSRPWLQPYTGETLHLTDTNTLSGKVMTGYQGWFGTPNDAADSGWGHWDRGSGSDPSPSEITIDMWPWINEYRTTDLYPAGDMVHQDGRPAYLFSSRDPETVQRHFRWMRKHNIDGAYLQRFVSRGSSGYYGASEFVLSNVRAAANKEGRVWAIEYDVSSLTGEANPLEVIQNDWNFLVNDCHILEDPRYVHEGGKPVLFIWGFSVPGREGLTLAEGDAILDWFGSQNLYLIGGVHSSWEGNTAWYDHYQKYDQLLAWMERTKSDLVSQKARLDSWGMKILPHAWPGFSWNNLQQTVHPQSYTARAGGQFYWDKLYNAVDIGADQIFLGMFDEYDEATAIMPMSDNHPDIHSEWGHYIDNEGLDPFWYLRLSGAARDMLNGLRPLTSTVPAESAVSESALSGDMASIQLGSVDVSAGIVHPQNADGLTEGALIDGQNCRTNLGNYFYFDIDDAWCYANESGQAVTIEIDFYDNVPGSSFHLQYDGLGSAYQNTSTFSPSASSGWKSIRWTVSDGFFGNRQNAGSDFRIAINGSAAIRSLQVIFPEEQDGAAEPAQLEYAEGVVGWPVLSDAVGWRLQEADRLSSNVWMEVEGPFSRINDTLQYNTISTNAAGFFRLQRPARK